MDSMKKCSNCGKMVPEQNLYLHEVQCQAKGTQRTPPQPAPLYPDNEYQPVYSSRDNSAPGKTSPIKKSAETSSQPISKSPQTASPVNNYNPKIGLTPASGGGYNPLQDNPPKRKPEIDDFFRCPKCTEMILIADYDSHRRNCPNEYCKYCQEAYPKELLGEHRRSCPRRPPSARDSSDVDMGSQVSQSSRVPGVQPPRSPHPTPPRPTPLSPRTASGRDVQTTVLGNGV